MKSLRKPRYFLVGGNGEVVEQHTVLPDITDDQIDMLYNKMIKNDPDHSKFTGTKREYVLEVHTQQKTFLLYQEAFKKEKLQGSGNDDGNDDGDNDDGDDDHLLLKKIEELKNQLTDKEKYKPIDDLLKKKPELFKIVYDSSVENKYTAEKVTDTLSNLIRGSKISSDDVNYTDDAFNSFCKGAKEALESSDLPEAKKLARNTLVISQYPYIGDFETFGGLGTTQLRVIIGRPEDSKYMIKLQGKYSEYIERSDEKEMESMGFIQDKYDESKFLFRSTDLLDSDTFDLQEINGKKISALGEIKAFGSNVEPSLQYTKLAIIVQLYDWLYYGDKEPMIGDYRFNKQNFIDRHVPFIVYGVDEEKIKSDTPQPTRDVFPMRVKYDGFRIADLLKANSPAIFTKLKEINLSENYEILDNRICKKGKKFRIGNKKEESFKLSDEDLRGCILSITNTRDGKSYDIKKFKEDVNTPLYKLFRETQPKKITTYPESFKIPKEGFTSYHYRLPQDTPKDKDSLYDLTANQIGYLHTLSKGEMDMGQRDDTGETVTCGNITKINGKSSSVQDIAKHANVPDFNTSIRGRGEEGKIKTVKYKLNQDLNDEKSKKILKEYLKYASKLILERKADKVKRLKDWYDNDYKVIEL